MRAETNATFPFTSLSVGNIIQAVFRSALPVSIMGGDWLHRRGGWRHPVLTSLYAEQCAPLCVAGAQLAAVCTGAQLAAVSVEAST